MKIAKSVLVKINNELKSKSDEQLKNLLNNWSTQLESLNEKDFEYFGEALTQKIALVEQELKIRKINIESTIS